MIAVALLSGGYWYYRSETQEIRRNSHENLAAIAKMKMGQIVQWRTERLYDARRAASGPVLRREALNLIQHPNASETWEDLRTVMQIDEEEGLYENVLLVGLDGKLLFAARDPDTAAFSPETKRAVAEAFASKTAVLSDLFSGPDGHVHLDAVGVVLDNEQKATGALILRCHTDDHLYRLIQSWPVPSRSAETFLVKREGEEVVFLNELRHLSKTALTLRFPLKQTDLPAVQAALGGRGMFEGNDYRHKPVLAELCAIPNSSWMLVAKVDQDEILAEAGYRAASTGVVVGALILLTAALTAFAYTLQRAGLFKKLLETERQQMLSNERYRTILYSIGDAVITTDAEGRVDTMNPVAERLTGWTEAEANGKPLEKVFSIVNQDTRTVVDNPVSTVLRSGEVVTLANHTVLIARDGTEHAIADSAAPIRDESGSMSGVVLVVSDVSEQYRIREDLRRSEREYRMLFEGMLEGFALHEIICDDSGTPIDYRFLSINPAFEQLTGLRAADALGRTVKEVIPGIEQAWIDRYGRVALTGEPVHFEESSSAFGRHFRATAFRPQPNQFAVIFEDITDRKAAEARIARLTQLYAALSQCDQAIVHSSSVEELLPKICRCVVEFGGMKMAWIGLIDDTAELLLPAVSYGSGTEYLDGLRLSLNPQDTSSQGPTGTAIRTNEPYWCQDFQKDPRTAPWRERAKSFDWGASAALPLCLRGKPVGALTFYSDKAQAFDTEMRELLLEMANDISFALENFERKAEHKRMEEKVLQTQRLESIGTLASGVAHDLNNILTPVILSADLLHTATDPKTRTSLISSIEECAKRGANVVSQLLTFARGTKGDRTTLNLESVVTEMTKVVRETFPRNITITTSIPPDLWLIKGDSTQIHQVLLNLCINARDAMDKGGVLLISGANIEIDRKIAALAPDARPGQYAMLSVADRGAGIPNEIVDKIFDPFFTTKETGKGTGLGLSTVMGIVRSHGGFITVNSEENKGSTFKVFLPRETNGLSEEQPAAPVETSSQKGETILVVDDEGLIAKATSILLEKNGYKTLIASGGTEALALYKERASEIKAVVTDVMMPGVDGVQLAREIKAITPRIPIIAFTGQATETRQTELRALGINVVLCKPFDPKKLLLALEDALRPQGAWLPT
ncbi:MAG: PAS domain S-box protein [Verrucomicrobiota bacterium]